VDSDHDGLPDDWERKHGLDPNNPADGALPGQDGYTQFEDYLDSLVPHD
jgi:pectate lyase